MIYVSDLLRTSLLTSCFFVSLSVNAFEIDLKKTKAAFDNLPNVVAQHSIATERLLMLELEDGTFLLSTGDGRFVIKGASLFSSLNTRYIKNVKEFKEADQLTYQQIGIKLEELSGFYINESADKMGGSIFVSQTCPTCYIQLKRLKKNFPDKRFKVIVTPILSKAEYRDGILAQCANDPSNALRSLVDRKWSQLRFPINSEDNECRNALNAINLNIASLQMLMQGQRMAIPALINNEGQRFMGLADDHITLKKFIDGE